MPDVLFDPREKEIRPWQEPSGQPIYNQGGISGSKSNVARIRELVAAKNIPLSAVPVVHRGTNQLRYWNIKPGEIGAPMYCEKLCTIGPGETGWRLATDAEVKAKQAKDAAARKAAAEEAVRKKTSQMVAEAALYTHMTKMPEVLASLDEKEKK